jgi:hypothetical protein
MQSNEEYDQIITALIDSSFTKGVKAEQLRMADQLLALLKVADSVSNPDWQEGYLIAINLVKKVIEQDNDPWKDDK